MDSMPDHILLSIFKQSLMQDRLLSYQLVSNRWRHLAFYNLCKDIGTTLDVGAFEKISVVGLKNRNNVGAAFESSKFLYKLLKFILELSEIDSFKCLRFSTSKSKVNFPEWLIDEDILELIHSHCPNMEKIDFGNGELDAEAMTKLLQFDKLKHLAIRRVDSNFAFALDLLQLESLIISGKQAPLSSVSCNQLRQLTIESPVPSSYFDLLQTLDTSAPNLGSVIRRTANDRDPIPGDVLAQIRSHPNLKTFLDKVFFLNDDNALGRLIETKLGQFESLRVNTEDCLRLSVLGRMERLKNLFIDGRNLEPSELASVFSIPTLENLKLSWTFKDDRSLDAGAGSTQKMIDVRCAGLKSIFLHLDFLSANGRAWGKNVITNVLQQCPRLRRTRNSDWLLAPDFVELRDVERFVDVTRKIDININSAADLFSMLHVIEFEADQLMSDNSSQSISDTNDQSMINDKVNIQVMINDKVDQSEVNDQSIDQFFTADPFCWRRLTKLSVFINEDYYVCDLSCVNGDALPNLSKFKICSDDDVYFERFCQVETLKRLISIDGVVRFENSNAELDWLDQMGEHGRFASLSTIQTTLTASLFCDVLMRARARMREAGFEPPATVLHVSISGSRKLRATEIDRMRWNEIAKILYTSRIMLRVISV